MSENILTKETMKRYKDYDGVKQKLKTYSKKTGLKYRNMGCQESNNYCRLTRRMKKKTKKSKKDDTENVENIENEEGKEKKNNDYFFLAKSSMFGRSQVELITVGD